MRDSVSRLFLVRMKLGEFDPPEMNPYTKYGNTKSSIIEGLIIIYLLWF